MNVRPLYDRILVKRSEEEESTRNGISFQIPRRRSRKRPT